MSERFCSNLDDELRNYNICPKCKKSLQQILEYIKKTREDIDNLVGVLDKLLWEIRTKNNE